MHGSTGYPQLRKTRLAPTPSGYLHLGNVLSFVITVTLAHKCGAEILLRIDDMDRERMRDEYLQDIFDTFCFLEIPYNEGPKDVDDFKANWSQLHRTKIYQQALGQLTEQGDVFACRCSRAQLQQHANSGYPQTCLPLNLKLDEREVCWRIETGDNLTLTINNWPHDSLKTNLPADMQSFIVRKKDGLPAYQLSSLCDDVYFGVDLIVRGQDLWHSTIAQQYLAHKLGAKLFKQTTFYHHPLITASDGHKLSKSMGATSVKYLREHGMRSAEVFKKIAEHMGLNGTFNNWLQLGEAWLRNNSATP